MQRAQAKFPVKLFDFYASYKERLVSEERDGRTLALPHRRAIFQDEAAKKKYKDVAEEVLLTSLQSGF